MDQQKSAPQPASKLPIPRWEFIALCAALMALNSLAIDIMLPALQQIGASLGVENENHRQYVITAYILGFGGGQLFFGPISDRLRPSRAAGRWAGGLCCRGCGGRRCTEF